ncbi:MAG: hypothetical protein QM602_09035 [Microbacterium sp.]
MILRRARRAALPILAIAAVLGLSACATASPEDAESAADGETAAVVELTPTDAEAIPTGVQEVTPSASGWLAGSRVTPTKAVYDPEAGTVVVTVDVENTANTEAFNGNTSSWIFLDTGSGAPANAHQISSVAVPESTTEIDLSFYAPAEPFVLEDAVLQFGAATQKQWLVPLKPGATGEGIEPIDVPASETIKEADYRIDVTAVQVLPWTCSGGGVAGGAAWVSYEPVVDDKLGVIVWADFTPTKDFAGGNALWNLYLDQPDGKSVAAEFNGTPVQGVGDHVEDFPFCFTVDDPAAGEYTIRWETYRDAATASYTFALSG